MTTLFKTIYTTPGIKNIFLPEKDDAYYAYFKDRINQIKIPPLMYHAFMRMPKFGDWDYGGADSFGGGSRRITFKKNGIKFHSIADDVGMPKLLAPFGTFERQTKARIFLMFDLFRQAYIVQELTGMPYRDTFALLDLCDRYWR